MDVVSELRTDRGPHCGMKGSHTLQTLEEARREAPVSSPRTSTRKITIGPQTNSTLEIETETTLRGGDSPMEIESLPETKFGNAFALQIEPLPETKFAGIESLPETSPETKAGEAFGIQIAVSPEMKFGEPSTKENEAPLDTSFGGDSALEIEASPVKIFSSLIISEDFDERISKGAQGEEMKEDPFPSHIGSRNAEDLSREKEKEEEKVEPFGERFPPDDLNKNTEVKTVVLEATSTTPPDSKLTLMEGSSSETLDPKLTSLDSKLILMEGSFSEPLDPELTSLDSKLALMEGSASEPLDPELTSLVSKLALMEGSSSKPLDPKLTSLDSELALMEGSSSEPLDPNLILKKESSSRSLDSNLPPKKQSSSRSLDSKLTPSMIRRRNRVSVTVLERMQQDPLLAEHFAQLETPTTEPISEFSSHGCEPRRSLKSTSRLKCTTDSVGIKYVNQYIVIKVLGRGTFGKVKLCLNTMDCKLYAVKILYRKSVARHSHWGTRDDVGKRVLREIAIMKKLNHPNVVALIEVIDDPSNRKLYLVLEYVEGGPIMVNDLWHPIPEEKARLYFRDMCQGLDYLHFNKIVHRDLKPGNLLQTMDGRIKISDFGVSHMLDHESDSIHGTAGTPAFLAPEICSGGECQGRAADIWALGVCLYVMVYGEIPFPAETVADMYKCIIDKKSLIMTKDPASRISLASIMQHDWVSNQGTEPLIPFKLQKTRVSTAMAVSEAEVKAAVNVKQFGLAALSNVEPVEKHFEPGEYIMRQGEEGQEMYLINSGECEVLVESRSLTQPSRGRMEYAIAERGPGQYIGEMALSTDTTKKPPKRTASIRAKTHVVTLVVSRDQVMEALSKNSEAAKSIADTIAERDQEMRRRMKALELRLPSFRPSSFRHTTEQESTKVEVLEHDMPNSSPESDEHAPKRANICLGCRIL